MSKYTMTAAQLQARMDWARDNVVGYSTLHDELVAAGWEHFKSWDPLYDTRTSLYQLRDRRVRIGLNCDEVSWCQFVGGPRATQWQLIDGGMPIGTVAGNELVRNACEWAISSAVADAEPPAGAAASSGW